MNMLSKNTLLFALALLLSQAQASNLSGVSYFDFSYIDGQGGVFDMKRTHLIYSNKLSHNINYNVVLDVERDSDDNNLSAYLSNAELRMQLFVESSISLGLIKMNIFDVQEQTWGYRYIYKSAMELYGFSASDDLGIGYYYKLKDFNFSALLTNGEGYNSSAKDSFQKYSFQFLYGKPDLKAVSKGSAFNAGLVLSIENFDVSIPRVGQIIGDQTAFDNPPESQGQLSGSKLLTGLFTGYTNESIMAGFEFNQYSSFDSEYIAVDPEDDGDPNSDGDGLLYNDDTLQGLNSTYGNTKNSTLISTYFSIGLATRFNLFFRADIYDPNIASDVIDDSQTNVLIGMHYALSNQINIAPLIKHNILESSDDGSTDLMINFEFNF